MAIAPDYTSLFSKWDAPDWRNEVIYGRDAFTPYVDPYYRPTGGYTAFRPEYGADEAPTPFMEYVKGQQYDPAAIDRFMRPQWKGAEETVAQGKSYAEATPWYQDFRKWYETSATPAIKDINAFLYENPNIVGNALARGDDPRDFLSVWKMQDKYSASPQQLQQAADYQHRTSSEYAAAQDKPSGISKAAPLILSIGGMMLGIPPIWAGALGGAAGSAINSSDPGDWLKGAAKGGVTAWAGGQLAQGLESAVGYNPAIANATWGEGANALTQAGAGAAQGALSGAAQGALNAGMGGRSVLEGALGGGLSGGINRGVTPGVSTGLSSTGLPDWVSKLGGTFAADYLKDLARGTPEAPARAALPGVARNMLTPATALTPTPQGALTAPTALGRAELSKPEALDLSKYLPEWASLTPQGYASKLLQI